MKLRLFDCYRPYRPYEGRFGQASSRRVWRWTPLTIVALLGFGRVVFFLPVHPFFFWCYLVAGTTLVIFLSMALLPLNVGWPIGSAAAGTCFGLFGSTLVWLMVFLLMDPTQQNKLVLGLTLGFWGTAALLIGASIITALVLGGLGGE